MCLIVFAYDMHPDYRLILAANRDEFFDRPATPAHWWDEPAILAGRDLQRGGSWLGLDRRGRLAAVTNVRNPQDILPDRHSRGELVPGFLRHRRAAADFVSSLDNAGYAGYNLLLADGHGVHWSSNRLSPAKLLPPGLYALSNAALDTPWPKVRRAKLLLANHLAERAIDPAALFALLADGQRPDDAALPDTGVGRDWERQLAPIFIQGAEYGTRCSSVLLQHRKGQVTFIERTFDQRHGGVAEVRFTYAVTPFSGPSVAASADN